MQLPATKHLPAAFIILLLMSTVRASAQDTTWRWSRPNLLKTNLLAPVSVFYERALTRRFALRTSVRAFAGNLAFNNSRFVNATLEGKIYTARLARLAAKAHPAGFFVNPYLKARSLTYSEEIGQGPGNGTARDEMIVRSLGAGLTVGYQWVGRRGFTVELVHGFGGFFVNNIRHTMRYSNIESGPNDYLSIDFRSGVSLGYAF